MAKPPKTGAETYTPSGYPEHEATFQREAKKLLGRRKADIEKVDRYFEEMSRLLEKKLPR